MSTNAEGAVATDREDWEKVEGRRPDDDDDDGLIERKKGIAKMTRGRERRKATQVSRRRLMGKTL